MHCRSNLDATTPKAGLGVDKMTEFELNRDTVQFIIDKAHEFHARDDVTFAEEPEIADEY